MDITLKQIVEINKNFGGHLRSDSSLQFAASQIKGIRSNYRKAAILVRAIVIYHPFSDANKRTALYAIDSFVPVRDGVQMAKAIIIIAKKNIISIEKIIEVIKNNNRRNIK